MQIAVIRHLPTEWNQKGVLQGSRNIPILPLTSENQYEIDQNRKKLSQVEPADIVLTSSLIRTQETAENYGYTSFKIEPLLDELNFGEYEGVPKSTLLNDYPVLWTEEPKKLTLGESLIDFEKRVLRFIEVYNDYSNVIVFGHGSWIRALISIKTVGSINSMNKVKVKNNDLILLDFPPLR
ncbi:histidine phosphatase family protein [Litchfieldia salsa]|uniref:Probable phosphoglycerate mutase n=1 Tax=Litchfieldia salsa TaxID=930152 RepID=A0A1H0TG71_9BACI|nr:phosphoglycerate mutase family protein [Litchfieldia salsa]SDP52835.1 probable phosphoglycerate mutase [Litchfieldia salsa]